MSRARGMRPGVGRATRALVFALLAAMLPGRLHAQATIVLRAGTAAQVMLTPGDPLSVPVVVDPSLSDDPASNIASMTAEVAWSPCLAVESVTPGLFGTVTFGAQHLDDGGIGKQEISLLSPTGTKKPFVLVTYNFRAIDGCHGHTAKRGDITVTVSAAGSEGGTNILPRIATTPTATNPLISTRQATCVGYTGLWGGVRTAASVTLLDAQQIARWSVSLPVLAPDRLAAYGDVTRDSVIDIIDAQQIARYSLSLSTASRAGEVGPTECVTDPDGQLGNISILPGASLALAAGRATRLSGIVTERSPFEGRYDVSDLKWASTDTTIAVVNDSGVVTAIGVGTVGITAWATKGARVVRGQASVTVAGVATTAAPASSHQLTTQGGGTGTGTLSAKGAALNCTSTAAVTTGQCALAIPSGTVVELSALAANGSTFTGWSAPSCPGVTGCTVVMDTDRTITAQFSAAPAGQNMLTVFGNGTGAGNVTSSPSGIDCTVVRGTPSGLCAGSFQNQSKITLTAVPTPNSVFRGWTGGCAGADSCVVTLDSARNVSAQFDAYSSSTVTLTAVVHGGGGDVHTQAQLIPGILCTAPGGTQDVTCTGTFPLGQLITLTATNTSLLQSQGFNGWGGECEGMAAVCQFSMSRDRRVDAYFGPRWPVSVSVSPAGTGNLIVSQAGLTPAISCHDVAAAGTLSPCYQWYPQGALVTLNAQVAPNYGFAGWSGVCYGRDRVCEATVTSAYSVVGTFKPLLALTVSLAGAGSGKVVSNAGARDSVGDAISCALAGGAQSGTCASRIMADDAAALVATPAPGSSLFGWGGACAGNALTLSCSVTMSKAQAITVRFEPSVQLVVAGTGSGSGSVAVSPVTLNCIIASGSAATSGCSTPVATGLDVTLTATAVPGSALVSWSGACSGTASTCTVSMGKAQTVTARFETLLQISVKGVGTGSGRVTAAGVTPALDCRLTGGAATGACAGTALKNLPLGLVVTPDKLNIVKGWSGICVSSSSTCALSSATADGVANASLVAPAMVYVTPSGGGRGTVAAPVDSAGYVNCAWSPVNFPSPQVPTGNCAVAYPATGTVTLTATPASSTDVFVGWGGRCSGSLATCSVPLDTVARVSAVFSYLHYAADSVAATYGQSCALKAGNMTCWGGGLAGFGNPSVNTGLLPTPAGNGVTFRSLSFSESYHACGMGTDGMAYCWGDNSSGQLGTGSTTASPIPVQPTAPTGNRFASIAVGISATCGLTPIPAVLIGGGTYAPNAYCWGDNQFGELGDGTTTKRLTPAKVATSEAFRLIVAGGKHACGLNPAGSAFCWGSNANAQTGTGIVSNTSQTLTPTAVLGGHTFSTLAAETYHTCGLTAAGQVYCWGFLAKGGGNTASPLLINLPPGVTLQSVSLGGFGDCGLDAAGLAYCWGGYGSPYSSVPQLIDPSLHFSSISIGFTHACGRLTDGSLVCWGANNIGQLGIGIETQPASGFTPVRQP